MRLSAAGAATVMVLGPLAWFWQASLLPDSYSVMDMGYPDYGGGPTDAEHHTHHARSVTTLVADPNRPADVKLTLVARKQRFTLPSGRAIDGYTVDGGSPGPVIRATLGQLVEVRLVNESVPDGVSLHWHGIDVPGAMDGVAGVTQDAIGVGGEFTYRFVADQVGTCWYHSHQVSDEQVRGGLLGAVVVTPPGPPQADVVDVVSLMHLYQGVRTVNGYEGDVPIEVPAGHHARIRIINTDSGEMAAWVAGAQWRVVAVDGTDLHDPSPLGDTLVDVAAGGRIDIDVSMPADGSGVRVNLGANALVLGSGSFAGTTSSRPRTGLDLLSYGSPAPLGFDPDHPNRRFDYIIGRRLGFLDGRPGMWWTVNGHQFPDVPMYVVAQGDVVRMHVANHSGDSHPMHLHGHHAVVLARNGVAATGSPWWVDSLTVRDGESYDIAFLADNPGIWMDHCHNLPHATEGLVAHLMYQGLTTPYLVGDGSGNQPE